jgi:hypothetical protein
LVLPVNEGGFDDPMTVSESGPSVSIPSVSSPLAEPIETCPVINPDKPYGVLKNGTKPTFKEWTLNNKDPPVENVPLPENVSLTEPVTLAQPAHIIKKIKVGKNKRTRSVDVLIENIHTRKLNKEKFQLLKKTNITTIKNYLKNRQFIKIGSNAPNSLIRYMYENIKECGDVVNENKSNLIHNFTKDTSF